MLPRSSPCRSPPSRVDVLSEPSATTPAPHPFAYRPQLSALRTRSCRDRDTGDRPAGSESRSAATSRQPTQRLLSQLACPSPRVQKPLSPDVREGPTKAPRASETAARWELAVGRPGSSGSTREKPGWRSSLREVARSIWGNRTESCSL